MSIALFVLALSLWFILTEGNACVGIRREDNSYDFDLPYDVAMEVQDHGCDAEWTVNGSTAIQDGDNIHFSLPFKNVTRGGISVSYCPGLVKYHVSCPNYNNYLECSCTNFTASHLFVNKSLESKDLPLPPDLSVRHHYFVIPIAVILCLTLVALAFLFSRAPADGKAASM